MPEILSVEIFLDKLGEKKLLLIDTRSEKEFHHANIPGSVNIPLLNNEHRHLVGIEYKKKGREAAVALGFELVGPHFHEFIKRVNELTEERELMVYCWRGGMRSSIMSWILTMAGYKVSMLKGGYKEFRKHIHSKFSESKNIIIVGGHTGSGKTEILEELEKSGEQVIDLENLANHKGSAFGHLGMPPQPGNEQFENNLGCLLRTIDSSKRVWIEGESRSIGSVKIPDQFFDQLQSAPLTEIVCSREFRKKRILNEYGIFSKEELSACTKKIQKRLGNLRLTVALKALEEGCYDRWLEILLDYYDHSYAFSMKERNTSVRNSIVVSDSECISAVAKRIIELNDLAYQSTDIRYQEGVD